MERNRRNALIICGVLGRLLLWGGIAMVRFFYNTCATPDQNSACRATGFGPGLGIVGAVLGLAVLVFGVILRRGGAP